RLHKVFTHRRKKAASQNVSCYRVYDLDLPEFPLAIDLYEQHLHASEYVRKHSLSPEQHEAWLQQSRLCMAEVLDVAPEHIHIKQRSVIGDRRNQYAHFAQRGERITVSEHGARFLVNLSDYLDTGLFLDHRPTRQLVRQGSAGKDV